MTSAAFVSLFKTQLETRFAANPTYSGVTVNIIYEDGTIPSVTLVRDRVRHDIEHMAMRVKSDEGVVPMLVRTSGDVQAAADQAAAIVGEIGAELRDNPPQVGTHTLQARVTGVAWMPLLSDKLGVVCDCELDVTYQAMTT